jgi:hypothetical protein
MHEYSPPAAKDAGSLHELTLSTIYKANVGTGDVIVYQGTSYPVPGGTVANVS